MGEKKKEVGNERRLKDMPVYDPDNLPYQTRHTCILLGELAEEAAENAHETPRKDQAGGQDHRQKVNHKG